MKTTLVADSDVQTRQLLKKLLSTFGQYDVLEAGDGADALAKLRSHTVDIAFLDATLPFIDGIFVAEVMHRLPQFYASSAVIMLPENNASLYQRAVASGASAFLEKPISAESLKNLLSGTIETTEFATLPKSHQVIAQIVGDAAKSAMRLTFGNTARVVKTQQPLPQDFVEKYDVIAQLKATCTTPFMLQIGLSEVLGKMLCEAQGKQASHVDVTARAGAELLQAIVNRATPRLAELGAVRLEPARHSIGQPLINGSGASVLMRFRIIAQRAILRKQLSLPLLIAFDS